MNYKTDGSWTVEEYRDGKKHGRQLHYRADGSLDRENAYQDGEMHGKHITYSADGTKLVFTYVNGELHGLNTVYAKDGRVVLRYLYENGEQIE